MLLARRHSDSVRLTNTAFQTLQSAEPKEFRRYLREQKYLWVIDASGRGVQFAKILGGVVRRSYGRRCVISTEALLVRESDRNTCWIESLPDGWLFLAPVEDGHAVLQAMVSRTPTDPSSVLLGLLEQSMMREICVINSDHPVQSFDAAPQISEPLCGPGWIAIGEAAVSLDPVCGDGVGYATRGAALAAGVINGIGSGLSPEDCFSHYRQRLCNTFSAHLRSVLNYYNNAFSSLAWQSEIETMKDGFKRYADARPLKFALIDSKLVSADLFSGSYS